MQQGRCFVDPIPLIVTNETSVLKFSIISTGHFKTGSSFEVFSLVSSTWTKHVLRRLVLPVRRHAIGHGSSRI